MGSIDLLRSSTNTNNDNKEESKSSEDEEEEIHDIGLKPKKVVHHQKQQPVCGTSARDFFPTFLLLF
jgi:hypothetical protein